MRLPLPVSGWRQRTEAGKQCAEQYPPRLERPSTRDRLRGAAFDEVDVFSSL